MWQKQQYYNLSVIIRAIPHLGNITLNKNLTLTMFEAVAHTTI